MGNKKTNLTEHHKAYMDANWKFYTHEQISIHLGIPTSTVTYYCYLNGYKKLKLGDEIQRAVRKIPKRGNPGPETKLVKRWPADHTNMSREQHIDRILNMPL